ncbi:MAG: IMP cyclohydrolase, partial [Candidatus Hydrogenedentes bacterium]|nr:IMP cyclohydrolase [Candidatus Hydrogenedentota bacterium]
MYVGRIVSIAMTKDSRLCGVYRVSSRSFPNRTAVLRENRVSIVPKPGHEA